MQAATAVGLRRWSLQKLERGNWPGSQSLKIPTRKTGVWGTRTHGRPPFVVQGKPFATQGKQKADPTKGVRHGYTVTFWSRVRRGRWLR